MRPCQFASIIASQTRSGPERPLTRGNWYGAEVRKDRHAAPLR